MARNEYNPWDKTIWDPTDPEHAIEDPLHGSFTVHELLSIPPMPLEDGTFYQPGAFYVCGTNYFDGDGRPIFKVGTSPKLCVEMILFARQLEDWLKRHQQGEFREQDDDTIQQTRKFYEGLEDTSATE